MCHCDVVTLSFCSLCLNVYIHVESTHVLALRDYLKAHMFTYAKLSCIHNHLSSISFSYDPHPFYCGKHNDAASRLRLPPAAINNLPVSSCLPRFNQRPCVLMIMETISNNRRYVRCRAAQVERHWRVAGSVTSRDLVLPQCQVSLSHCRICRFLVDSVGSINSWST